MAFGKSELIKSLESQIETLKSQNQLLQSHLEKVEKDKERFFENPIMIEEEFDKLSPEQKEKFNCF